MDHRDIVNRENWQIWLRQLVENDWHTVTHKTNALSKYSSSKQFAPQITGQTQIYTQGNRKCIYHF